MRDEQTSGPEEDDRRVEDLLSRAAELPPDRRASFLRGECAGEEPKLLARLLELLAAHDLAEAEGFLHPSSAAPRSGGGEQRPGTRIGQYRLLRRLGVGSTGVVYEALHVEMNRRVAFKLLDPELARHATAFARFRREIKLLASLEEHPNVVRAIDASSIGPHSYLVTEFLDGATLRDVIHELVKPGAGLEAGAVAAIASQILAGLGFLAEHRMVHRDLSPSNVLVTRPGRVKVIDFGLARLAEPDSSPEDWLTQRGSPLGNPAYMSPEQHTSPSRADGRADLYSLGCLLYHLLAGFAPFFDRADLRREDLPRSHANALPTPLGQVRPDAPENMVRLVAQLMEKSPDARPSPQFAAAALEPLARNDSLLSLMAGMPSPAPTPSEIHSSSIASERRPLGRRLWPFAVLAALVVLFVVASWTLWPRGGARPSAGDRLEYRETRQLTPWLGRELCPKFSPDGKSIAFLYARPHQEYPQLHVKLPGDAEARRVTIGDGAEWGPAWSPDGKRLAISRHRGKIGWVIVVATIAAPDGTPELLIDVGQRITEMDWTPNGKRLVFTLYESSTHPPGVYFLNLETKKLHCHLKSPAHARDFSARVSPNGREVAFVRTVGTQTDEQSLCVVPLEGAGSLRTVLARKGVFRGVDWTADSAELVFSHGRYGRNRLWRIPVGGGEPAKIRLLGILEGASLVHPSVSRASPSALAFTILADEWTVWRQRIAPEGQQPQQPPESLFSSNRSDDSPAYSRDGRRVAFASDRSGTEEVWVYDFPTRQKRQVTRLGGPNVGSPSWHPDGRRIVFDSTTGRFRLFVVDADDPRGGESRLVAIDRAGLDSACLPRRSPDGEWIVFTERSRSEGTVWKVPAAGGAPVQITTNTTSVGQFSPDGKWLYYLRDGTKICKIPFGGGGGGEEAFVQDHPLDWNTWAPGNGRVYSLASPDRVKGTIRVKADGRPDSRLLGEFRLENPHLSGCYPGGRIAVSPREDELLFVQYSRDVSNVHVVDGFR